MDCSPPGSSVLGISQARILEWFAISFSRGPSPLRDWPQVSCIAGGFFYCWAIRVYTQNQLYTRKIVSVNFVEHDNSYLFSSLNFYQNSEVYTISCICLKREIGIKFTYFVYSQSKRKKKKKQIHSLRAETSTFVLMLESYWWLTNTKQILCVISVY